MTFAFCKNSTSDHLHQIIHPFPCLNGLCFKFELRCCKFWSKTEWNKICFISKLRFIFSDFNETLTYAANLLQSKVFFNVISTQKLAYTS